jgi:hypothetical protein
MDHTASPITDNGFAEVILQAWDHIDPANLHPDALDGLHRLAGEMRIAIEEEWMARDNP